MACQIEIQCVGRPRKSEACRNSVSVKINGGSRRKGIMYALEFSGNPVGYKGVAALFSVGIMQAVEKKQERCQCQGRSISWGNMIQQEHENKHCRSYVKHCLKVMKNDKMLERHGPHKSGQNKGQQDSCLEFLSMDCNVEHEENQNAAKNYFKSLRPGFYEKRHYCSCRPLGLLACKVSPLKP